MTTETPTEALQTVDDRQQFVDTQTPLPTTYREITPTEARNTSIAHTLDAAYSKASTLTLTPEETKALMAEFPDSDIHGGARGKENLLYLEHAAVRRRLMEVFGPGQWAIINRRSWLDEDNGWLYADIVLLCRGCFVGESVGANRYSAQNKATNYSDAVKGAESDALGRIAGTALGVGLQLWSKTWCEGWHQRNRSGTPPANRREYPVSNDRTYQKSAPQANVERTAATPAAVLPAKATEKTREWAWNSLVQEFGPDKVWDFLLKNGRIAFGSNDYSGWILDRVPTSKQALAALADEIRKTLPQNAAPDESKQIVDADGLPKEIGDTVISVPRKGQKRADYLQNPDTIASLWNGSQEDRKRLFGLKDHYNPEPWISFDGKKHPPSQEDVDCRIGLDLFADWVVHRKDGSTTEMGT